MLKTVRAILIVLLNLIFYGLVVFGGVKLCQVSYSFAYEILGDMAMEMPPGQDKFFTITESQDEFAVANNLEEMELVKNKYSFYLRMQLKKTDKTALKPGSYTLNTSMSYDEILHAIWQ
ncbi:MAG: hypothetical protein SOZ48_07015 [Eubacterium sp.]|nr:hypothetical protein [Eubacterium sp.]